MMFLLTLKDRKDDGAYAVENGFGEKVLFLFEEEDDATRYALMLEDDEEKEMEVVEVDDELDVTTPYRQVLANYDNYKTDTETQNSDSIDRSKLLALVKRYLEHRKILADWEIIKQTPTEQLINYSGILVPFTPEEKQLLLEAKTLITRGHALEALYQSYIFDLSGEKSDQLH